MASSVRLTSADPGNPPVLVARDHVTKVVPRKAMRPDLASQHQHFHSIFEGAKLSLVTGETINVIEDHNDVAERVWGGQTQPLTSGTIAQSQIPGLNSVLSSVPPLPADEPTSAEQIDQSAQEPTLPPPPAKKAPAKKVAPPAGGKAEAKDEEEE